MDWLRSHKLASLLLGIIALGAIFLIYSKYIREEWTLMVCKERLNAAECNENSFVIEGFKSAKECLLAGADQFTKEGFECGKNCRMEGSLKICKEICNAAGCGEKVEDLSSYFQKHAATSTDQTTSVNSEEINLAGTLFSLYRVERINKGWGAYYSPKPGNVNPDIADESMIVNYYLPTYSANDTVSAESIAEQVQAQAESEGAVLIAPFTAPDSTNGTQSAFFIQMYKIFESDAEVWITKIAQDNNRAYSVLYKKRFYGSSYYDMKSQIESWLLDNFETYGSAISEISVNDSWFKKQLEANR